MNSTEVPWPDLTHFCRMGPAERRPNVLVRRQNVQSEALINALIGSCLRPFRVCGFPGPLRLPVSRTGTLFLDDVCAMTLHQQILLQDWMDADRGRLQIVSIASEPLYSLVLQGQFIEGLFYRLNVVSFEAGPSDVARWSEDQE